MSRIQENNFYYVKELYSKYIGYSGSELFLSQSELSWLAEHGPIRVGYRDNYLAFCAQDPDTGELTGALKDFLELASHSTENAEIEFTAVPVSSPTDSLDMLMSGEVDCLFPTNVSDYDGEELHLSLTIPLMQTGMVAVVRQSAQREFSPQGEVTVAVNEGNPDYETFLNDHFPQWNRVYFTDTEASLAAVGKGEADCISPK
ncbi:MAG: transporter substrate-binding domain-containing protein [Clostridia bacterium]|nr:transporter substrate-binding domain-containing protein [Clostridia bacterium]